ncbi:cyclic lactone autoinducer peptide [Clostridium cadaveris]|nr:cyclic lactone autoinducer peptide [Clostridium cadaveris]UFH66034.1 cyclic lactone autoinducer peptide [Clostridium cadaveris]
MKKKVLMSLAAISTFVASLVATSACFFCFYQPEEPKSLREE